MEGESTWDAASGNPVEKELGVLGPEKGEVSCQLMCSLWVHLNSLGETTVVEEA